MYINQETQPPYKMKNSKEKVLQKVYNNFKEEAELFFVSKFIEGNAIKKEFTSCLDILFNITKTLDSNKGIIAYNSDYGQSKTFFFDVVRHRLHRTKNVNLFKKTTAKELCNIYVNANKGEDPLKNLDKFIRCKNLFIDDIGDELRDGKERMVFGNRLNVVRYVLLKRYEWWVEKGWKTYGTTNLTLENVAENYDGRVADRIQQMAHWRGFKFLSEGSFRQRTDTRMLNQDEIRLNMLRLNPVKEVDNIDLEQYFNSLLDYSEEKLVSRDSSFWSFCKTYLIAKKIIKKEDFVVIDEDKMEASRIKLISQKKDYLKSKYRNAPPGIYKSQVNLMISRITTAEVREFAEDSVVRGVFIHLKKTNYKFK